MATSHEWFVVQRSAIHRRGVFARVDIPKGTRIIEYKGEKITKAQAQRRGTQREASAKKSGNARVFIFELNKRYDLDGAIPNNPAKYINHSCDNNCESQNIRGKIWIIAARAIPAGTELSFDYGYDAAHFLDHPCYCGSPDCLGYIVRKDQRWRVRKLLKGRGKTAASKSTAQ